MVTFSGFSMGNLKVICEKISNKGFLQELDLLGHQDHQLKSEAQFSWEKSPEQVKRRKTVAILR